MQQRKGGGGGLGSGTDIDTLPCIGQAARGELPWGTGHPSALRGHLRAGWLGHKGGRGGCTHAADS